MSAPIGRWLLGGLAVLFGVATVIEGGRTLFFDPAARATAVPFVLGFNFAAGFVYLAAGTGILFGRGWASWLAWGIAATTALVFAAFGVHVALGGAFAARTVVAMTLRTGFWFAVALLLPRLRGAARVAR